MKYPNSPNTKVQKKSYDFCRGDQKYFTFKKRSNCTIYFQCQLLQLKNKANYCT